MDYPKSVPSVGLVNGQFVDENPVTGTPGSLVPAAWGNSITEEVLNVIEGAGLDLDEADLTQLLQAIRRIDQAGSGNFATDTGTASVYVVVYTPAITARADGMVLRFMAKTTNSGSSTFSPNGLTAKEILGLSLSPLQAGGIVAGGICSVIWSATLDKWVLLSCTGGDAEASKLDAEAGTSNTKWMSPLRVFQAIRSVAALATETLRGVLRVGTQAEVEAGLLDMVAVTPKKLKWGFSASIATNGYIVFPTWLGSFIIQWANGQINAGAGIAHITLALEFPYALIAYSVNTSSAGTMMSCQSANNNGIDVVTRTVSAGALSIPTGIVGYTFICVGK